MYIYNSGYTPAFMALRVWIWVSGCMCTKLEIIKWKISFVTSLRSQVIIKYIIEVMGHVSPSVLLLSPVPNNSINLYNLSSHFDVKMSQRLSGIVSIMQAQKNCAFRAHRVVNGPFFKMTNKKPCLCVQKFRQLTCCLAGLSGNDFAGSICACRYPHKTGQSSEAFFSDNIIFLLIKKLRELGDN